MTHVLKHASGSAAIQDFSPYGYDERQYCSPGFNLPVGLFQRSQYGAFPEYHTSADSLDFIRPEHLAASHDMIMAAIEVLETDGVYRNTNPCCEPALGRRGLYATIGGDKDGPAQNMALLWVLNMSDGGASLLDIAERSGLAYSNILQASRRLSAADLLIPADSAATSG